jgi:hypothetical protein
MQLLDRAAEAGGSVLPAGFAVTQSGLRIFHAVW